MPRHAANNTPTWLPWYWKYLLTFLFGAVFEAGCYAKMHGVLLRQTAAQNARIQPLLAKPKQEASPLEEAPARREPLDHVPIALSLHGAGEIPTVNKTGKSVDLLAIVLGAQTAPPWSETTAEVLGHGVYSKLCHCKPFKATWHQTNRTRPKCVYIDLGAGEGRGVERWTMNEIKELGDCPSGEWEVLAIEANPRTSPQLAQLCMSYNASRGEVVTCLTSTAAYMCEDTIRFWPDIPDNDFIGTSLSKFQPLGLQAGVEEMVSVVNFMRLIYEQTIKDDYVVVNMDIEGAEWDVLPCLAKSLVAAHIDELFIDFHPRKWSLVKHGEATLQHALRTLMKRKVFIRPQSGLEYVQPPSEFGVP